MERVLRHDEVAVEEVGGRDLLDGLHQLDLLGEVELAVEVLLAVPVAQQERVADVLRRAFELEAGLEEFVLVDPGVRPLEPDVGPRQTGYILQHLKKNLL